MAKEYLTVRDVADQFDVSESTVRRWIRKGMLSGRKVGVQWRFSRSEVQAAYERGDLSVGNLPAGEGGTRLLAETKPQWANPYLEAWYASLSEYLAEIEPDHVVVNDRRGGKVWAFINPEGYEWGRNLWHSTCLQVISDDELKQLFGRKTVLLFDEMMQHGQAMHDLRLALEAVHATVHSFVCVCRQSHLESGETIEHRARPSESLPDAAFAERATLISRLMTVSVPPLDVDHLVVRGRLQADLPLDDFLTRLANWGLTFLVTYPDPDTDHGFLAVTLDRPQFFDTAKAGGKSELHAYWDGPCKIRLYIDPNTRECYCVFIVYPRLCGTRAQWSSADFEEGRRPRSTVSGRESYVCLARRYEIECVGLASSLLEDFLRSGAAHQIGVALTDSPEALDSRQLRATFGPKFGEHIEKRVRAALSSTRERRSFAAEPKSTLSLFLRAEGPVANASRDVFDCRSEFLGLVPQKPCTGQAREPVPAPVTYSTLVARLADYSEATVGQVLDYEIDWGTIKPVVYETAAVSDDGIDMLEVGRGFQRGEFDPPFDMGDDAIHSHDDLITHRILGMGPTVLEQFLGRVKKERLIATHFAKLFANLRQDWDPRLYALGYCLRPYKYGPIPVVSAATASADFQRLEQFLVRQKVVREESRSHGSQIRKSYVAADESAIPWRQLYERTTNGTMKAHIAGLVRLYSTIQTECKTQRASSSGNSGLSFFSDPLVVLASARNQMITYHCGYFELDDWRKQGEAVFATLSALAEKGRRINSPFLSRPLQDFARSAALLRTKIEMYRNLPFLRDHIQQIVDTGEFDMGHVVLESIDREPMIETDSKYPVGTLDWSCQVMLAFSSFVRQVLTICGLDVDKRHAGDKADAEGHVKGSTAYLNALLTAAPELAPLKIELQGCIEMAVPGELDPSIARSLGKAFRVILGLFDAGNRLPRPNIREQHSGRLKARLDLLSRLHEVPLPDGYCVAVADIKNFLGITRFIAHFTEPDEAEAAVLGILDESAKKACEAACGVEFCGVTGDGAVFAGKEPASVVNCMLGLIRITTVMIERDMQELAQFALLRVGFAWRESLLGQEYKSTCPGTTAWKIGDKSDRPLGALAITAAVYDRLPAEVRHEFALSEAEECGQGHVYVRNWNPKIDMH